MRCVSVALVGTVFLLRQSRGDVARAASPIKLNGPLVAGGDVGTVRMSPDGSLVFYRADQDADEVSELFSVPITGGTPIQLNPALVAGGDVLAGVDTLQFNPDGSRVLYLADQDVDEVVEIYSVPSGGGMPLQHNGALVAGGDVNWFATHQFSPNGSRVVYVADQAANDVDEIFSVLTTGGTTIKLNGALVAGGDAAVFRISPDSSRVVYWADQITNDVREVFSVAITGGTPVKLNGTLVAGGSVDASENDLRFTPDGTRVVYRADQTTDEVFEIYSVPRAGGTAVKLNGPLVAGGNVVELSLQISPNSSRLAYLADQDTDEVFELYGVPVGGGTPVKLNGPLVALGDVSDSFNDIQFSPDSSRVLYIADQITNNADELFSVPSAGGTPVRLNGPLVSGGDVSGFHISPDGTRVVYRAEQDTNGIDELYSVPIGGVFTPVKLSLPGHDVSFIEEFNPDSSRVLYYANQAADGPGYYLVPSAGGTTVHHTSGGTAVKVTGDFVAGGDVFTQGGPIFTPDGSIIIYTADQDTLDAVEAYARIVRQHTVGAGGSWDAGSTWNYGFAPDEVMQVFIDGSANVTATGSATVRTANELHVGNGAGTLTLASNAVITAINGVLIDGGGEVRGDGQITGDVAIGPLGELRAGANQQLRITGDVLNEGDIVASGVSGTPADIEFDGNIENFESIAARLAILRFNNGLYSEGDIFFTTGASEVFGDVNNQGTTEITNNAFVTFHDDYHQDATLIVEKTGTSAGNAVFLGAFTGFRGGSGGGNIIFEGDIRPGNSPATVEFENSVTLTKFATLHVELGGTSPGLHYDQVQVTGNLTLDGTLAVSLINGFMPALGNSFDILDWTSHTGIFDSLVLPALGAGLTWDFTQLHTTGVLSVVAAGVPGDYNDDGAVDAADYVMWRKLNGTSTVMANDPNPLPIDGDQYNTWRGNFGESAIGSGGDDSLVPEPAILAILLQALLFGFAAVGHRSFRVFV